MSINAKQLNPFQRIAEQRECLRHKQFNVKTELAELVEAVTAFPDQAILDQVQAIEETKTLFALVDVVDLENQGIDLTITCAKSGNICRQFTVHDYLNLKQIHGQERAAEIMQAQQFAAIDPKWLYTDSKSLDTLQIADPYGYCVHAISLLLNPLKYGKRWHDMPHHIQVDWHKQKAEANKTARNIPLPELVKLNEMLHRMLAIAHPSKIKTYYTAKTISAAMANHILFTQEIKDNLGELILGAHKRGVISQFASYGDAVELRRIYGGFSNFRMQRKPREKTETEIIQDIITECFADQKLPRYMSGHEPDFIPREKQRQQVYTAADLDKMIDAAVADLEKQTTGDKPVSGKLSFLQMAVMGRK